MKKSDIRSMIKEMIQEAEDIKRDGKFFVVKKRKALEKLKSVPNDSHIMVGGVHIHVLFMDEYATNSTTSNMKNHKIITVPKRPNYIVDFLLNADTQ